MPGESKGRWQQLSAVGCWLFFAVLARCFWLLFAAGACQKSRVSAAEAGLLAVFLRDLQRYQRRPRAAAPFTSSASESLFERGPNEALGIHRIVNRRYHAEKGVDHAGKLLVFGRHAGALQRLSISLTVVVQHIALGSNDNRWRRSGKAGRDRRGAPILRVFRAAQIVVANPRHRPPGQDAVAVGVFLIAIADQAVIGNWVDERLQRQSR